MTVPLPAGKFRFPTADFGKGPDGGTTPPIWQVQVSFFEIDLAPGPLEAAVDDLIAAADDHDVIVFFQASGNKFDWCDFFDDCAGNPGTGTFHYNATKYETNVEKFAGMAQVADAFTRRRFIAFLVDDPDLGSHCGTLTEDNWAPVNQMGQFYKERWPDCITSIRVSGDKAPAGMTNVDYLWEQYEGPLHLFSASQTPAQYYAQQITTCAAKGYRFIPGINMLDGGNGNCWDYLNTGSSSGRIAGTFTQGGILVPGQQRTCAQGTSGNTRWVCSPAEMRAACDAICDNEDLFKTVPCFVIWPHAAGNDLAATFGYLEVRSDFVAAFEYMLERFATRTHFNGWLGETPEGGGGGGGTVLTAAQSTPITARVTSTNTAYEDVTGASIAAVNLEAGEEYMIFVMARFDYSSTASPWFARMVSGSTAMPSTEFGLEPQGTVMNWCYFKWVKWTAVASEPFKLQFKVGSAGQTVGCNFAHIVAWKVSDLPAGALIYDDDDSTTGNLTTTPVNGATITFTPDEAGDYLVLTDTRYTNPSVTVRTRSQLIRSGEAASSVPLAEYEGENTGNLDFPALPLGRVFACTAVSNTFTEQSLSSSGTTGQRTHSRIMALRLNVFEQFGWGFTDAVVDITNVPSIYTTQVQTAGLTLAAESEVFVLALCTWVANGLGVSCNSRLQIDNADSPTGQTAAPAQATSADAADRAPIGYIALPTLASGAHTFDMDASCTSPVAGRGMGGRLMVAFTLDMVGGGGTVASPLVNSSPLKTLVHGALAT